MVSVVCIAKEEEKKAICRCFHLYWGCLFIFDRYRAVPTTIREEPNIAVHDTSPKRSTEMAEESEQIFVRKEKVIPISDFSGKEIDKKNMEPLIVHLFLHPAYAVIVLTESLEIVRYLVHQSKCLLARTT